jgi:hypothetical protein
MQKIIDFMGDESVWKTMIPDVRIYRRQRTRHVPLGPVAYFIDSHWTASNGKKLFNPYDHYQRPNTHKFCQTFCMMHLLNELPEPNYTYSYYDKCAREFIRRVITLLPDTHQAFNPDSKSTLVRILKRCYSLNKRPTEGDRCLVV